MPHLIVSPIRFNIFAKYSTLVYHIPLLDNRAKGSYNCAILHIIHLSCKDIIDKELKLAPAPNLFYSICMMCDGRFICEILYGAVWGHMDVPRWVPDESLLQNPHRSHMGCPYRTHIITHLGSIWVPYSLLAGL